MEEPDRDFPSPASEMLILLKILAAFWVLNV
jgi:hypothetical protein